MDFQNYPFEHTVRFDLAEDLDEILVHASEILNQSDSTRSINLTTWKGLLDVTSRNAVDNGQLSHSINVKLLDVPSAYQSAWFAIRQVLSAGTRPKLAFLDANRSYSYSLEPGSRGVSDGSGDDRIPLRNPGSYSGDQLFGEWVMHLRHQERVMIAGLRNNYLEFGEAAWKDPFESLNERIQQVLPYVMLVGADSVTNRMKFATREENVDFQQLSGGEREIVFIVGQLDMLSIEKGILLIDEPELHLHPSLLRQLIHHLGREAAGVQVILATHSFEAVEEALGSGGVFVLNDFEGKVSVEQVNADTAHAQITLAVGIPGLGIGGQKFVAVEGGSATERAATRFRDLIGEDRSEVVFINAGKNKRDVLNTMSHLNALATNWRERITLLGIVDGDFDSIEGTSKLSEFVLQMGIHEIENVYLQPEALDAAARTLIPVVEWPGASEIIQLCSDELAGLWVWNRTMAKNNRKWSTVKDRESLTPYADPFKRLSWRDLELKTRKYEGAVAGLEAVYVDELEVGTQKYEEVRRLDELWMHCLGKQLLSRIGQRFGSRKGAKVLERVVLQLWHEGTVPANVAMQDLRTFVGLSSPIADADEA